MILAENLSHSPSYHLLIHNNFLIACKFFLRQMALRGVDMGVAMALVTMLWTGASAQMGRMSAILSLSPCLSYVTGSSPTPSSSCCTQLAIVVSTQVQCLCTVLNSSSTSWCLQCSDPTS